MSALSQYSSDVERHYRNMSIKSHFKAIFNPSLRACFLIRLVCNNKNKFLHLILRNRLVSKYGIDIGINIKIGNKLSLPHPIGVVIGDSVRIGEKLTIYQNCTLGKNYDGYPVIGDCVTIYPGSVVAGDIKIGDNCKIGANSYLDKSLEKNMIFIKDKNEA